MRLTLIGLWLFALPAIAAGPLDFRNDREGKSYYSGRSENRAISRALKDVDGTMIVSAFQEVESETEVNNLCSFDFNKSLEEKLKNINPRFDQMEGAILFLRSQNEFDDTVTKILLTANETSSTRLRLPKIREELSLPSNDKTVDSAVNVLSNFERRLERQCFDEAYKSLYGDILKFDKNLKSRHLEALFVEAFERRVISGETYMALEKARQNELETSGLTLKAYFKKIESLRLQFPLRDADEKSEFVTGKDDDLKMSRRQRLLEGYTDLQIMLMANIIKKLRTRLESPKVEILIYDRTDGVETITLDPMERFRLAIKLLRKETALLSLNTYFAGRTPDYMDLMTAAYEVGIIPASELAEVAGLEEIWNPKKTFWEKAGVWVRTLSSVATIAIPPPYGFIPALAVVVIEMTAGKKKDSNPDPTVLF